MILAAGRGTRLEGVEPDRPKPLVEVGGIPLLERQLRFLTDLGVEAVVINAHHLSFRIRDFVDSRGAPPTVSLIVEPELLGTAGGVRNALPYLGSEPFLVVYGDVLLTEPLDRLVETHQQTGALISLAVYEAEQTYGKGVVEAELPWATGFAEKSGDGPGLVNAGIYVVDPCVIAELPLGVERDFGLDVLPQFVARGRTVAVSLLSAPLIDIGTPEGLAAARSAVAGEGQTER